MKQKSIIQPCVIVGDSSNLYEIWINAGDGAASGAFAPVEDKVFAPVPYRGDICRVKEYLASEEGIKGGYVFWGAPSSGEMEAVRGICNQKGIVFVEAPSLSDCLWRWTWVDVSGPGPVFKVKDLTYDHAFFRICKRLVDIVVSLAFLGLVYWWLYAIVAFIIHRQSPGPVIFRQKRSGRDNVVFYCLKFRSMEADNKNEEVQAVKDDERVFPFGRFMRVSGVDELPQFINVLKGEMSIIGPRAHMVYHTDYYSKLVPHYKLRLYMKQGITGWAQVNGWRGETREVRLMEGRVIKDIEYIENWNLRKDLSIILKSIRGLLFKHDRMAY